METPMSQEPCPKCGKPYLPPAESCPACGVIFAKLRPAPALPGGTPAPPGASSRPIRPIKLLDLPKEEPTFSLPLAFLHAILLCGVVAVLGAGLAVIGLIPELVLVPKMVVRLGGFLLVMGLAVSRGLQLQKRGVVLVSLGIVVLVLGILVYVLLAIQVPTTLAVAFNNPELQELSHVSSRLCHPVLGFSFPDPGPGFNAAPATQERMNKALKRPSVHHVWVFSNGDGMVVAQVFKGMGHTPISLRVFTGALRNSAVQKKAQVQSERFSQVEGRPAYHLAVDYPNGLQVDVRCLASGPDRPAGQPPLIFCLEGGGESRLPFQPMLGGMALRGCEAG